MVGPAHLDPVGAVVPGPALDVVGLSGPLDAQDLLHVIGQLEVRLGRPIAIGRDLGGQVVNVIWRWLGHPLDSSLLSWMPVDPNGVASLVLPRRRARRNCRLGT